MKLNYKRTIFVGFAFFLICSFWQAYDNTIPLILTNKFGMSQAWSGVIMALDNVLALFMLPLFGAISDKHRGKRGRRTPFIVVGTLIAAVMLIALSFVDNAQLRHLSDVSAIDDPAALEQIYDRQANETLLTPSGDKFVLSQKFTQEEARLLDLCLLVHADHGGGNCSTFTCRVLSSSGTDTYAAISSAIGALKGPKHRGANLKVMHQLDYILENVEDPSNDDEVREFLRKILRKERGDGSGLIYGMGHAVYTMSDPRAQILKTHAKSLAYKKGYDEEYELLCSIERLAPQVFAEEKHGPKKVCANVDLFSGLIYRMLGISEDLYTPLFAIARVPGWCAHRVEEVEFANRIIRPAYKYLGKPQEYVPLEKR